MKINDVLKKSLGATEIYSCIEHVEWNLLLVF